jgi:DASH complex subunit Dad3
LRLLERKTATVCTLLKASVYSIVLQQQIINEGEDGGAVGRVPADSAADAPSASIRLGGDDDD